MQDSDSQQGSVLTFLRRGVNQIGQLLERGRDDLADEAAAAHVLPRSLALPLALAHRVQDHLRVVRHAAHQLQRVEVGACPAQRQLSRHHALCIIAGVATKRLQPDAARDDCESRMAAVHKPDMSGGDLCIPSWMLAGLLQRTEEGSPDEVGCASRRAHLAPQASTAWRS